MFGQQSTAQTTGGLFASPVSSTSFGAKTPGFGGFGTNTSASAGLFGGSQQTSTLFGNPGASAGFVQTAPNGTTVKFNPPTSQDTMVKNGVSTNINTRHQCITAMKEYQSKSLEELRVEDYLSNRKGKQATTGFATPSASGTFNPTPASTGTSLFGQQQQPQQPQQQSTSLFGQSKPLFGASTATGTSGFSGFGTTTSTPSLFGQPTQISLSLVLHQLPRLQALGEQVQDLGDLVALEVLALQVQVCLTQSQHLEPPPLRPVVLEHLPTICLPNQPQDPPSLEAHPSPPALERPVDFPLEVLLE